MRERALSSSGLPRPEQPRAMVRAAAPPTPAKRATHWWKALLALGGLGIIAAAMLAPPLLSPEIPLARQAERIDRMDTLSQTWLRSIPAPSAAGTVLEHRLFLEPSIHNARSTPEQEAAALPASS